MLKKIIISILAVLGFVACSQGDTTDITGRIAMKGSSIHTYLVLEDIETKKSVKLTKYEAFGLMKRQNEVVTLKVKLLHKSAGPGFPAVVEVVEVK